VEVLAKFIGVEEQGELLGAKVNSGVGRLTFITTVRVPTQPNAVTV
jgi:hypothetical protein